MNKFTSKSRSSFLSRFISLKSSRFTNYLALFTFAIVLTKLWKFKASSIFSYFLLQKTSPHFLDISSLSMLPVVGFLFFNTLALTLKDHNKITKNTRNLKLSQFFKHTCVSKWCYFEVWKQYQLFPVTKNLALKHWSIFLGHPVYGLLKVPQIYKAKNGRGILNFFKALNWNTHI